MLLSRERENKILTNRALYADLKTYDFVWPSFFFFWGGGGKGKGDNTTN
jgi:hypothetical protein